MMFLTNTCTHKNNPDGTGLQVVQTDIPCSPIDPMDRAWTQGYPLEKLYLLRQCFTQYASFQPGDYLVSGTVTYAVKAVHPWTGSDSFYHLILELQSGS